MISLIRMRRRRRPEEDIPWRCSLLLLSLFANARDNGGGGGEERDSGSGDGRPTKAEQWSRWESSSVSGKEVASDEAREIIVRC